MYSFEILEIWHLLLELIEKVCSLTKLLLVKEKYELSNQVKRAVTSMSLNIAEGREANTDAEFRRYLGISLKSLIEVLSCLKICERLQFITAEDVRDIYELCDKLEAKIRAFRNTLNDKHTTLHT